MDQQTELVEFRNSRVVTSSTIVAESFGKRHSHVLRDIEVYRDRLENWADLYCEDFYLDSYGRRQKHYLMTRDGFTLLVMSYTGSKAIAWKVKYINAFNKMGEELQKRKSPLWREALAVAQELLDEGSDEK